MKPQLSKKLSEPYVVILGIAQDGGLPHIGCNESCCAEAWKKPSSKKNATCIGIIDPKTQQRWIIEASQDLRYQLNYLDTICPKRKKSTVLDGIFITHGHIGHYMGLIYLEKAMLSSEKIPVYTMPKMGKYLSANRPWKDTIQQKNITLHFLEDQKSVQLNKRISITPFLVPHRADYAETVGYIITGPKKSYVFIPDLDHWEGMKTPIEEYISQTDGALLDATFFNRTELKHRDMSKVPHPTIEESMQQFAVLPTKEKKKIHFIHLNHTNPVLNTKSNQYKRVVKNGFRVAKERQNFPL